MSTHRSSWRGVLDVQMAQWRWQNSERGMGVLAAKYRDEAERLQPQTRELLRSLYSSEPAKLLGADPIHVSADMCDVVAFAADPGQDRPFLPEPLYVTDLVTPLGFLVYGKPFDILDRFDRPVQIAAAAWQPMFSVGDDDDPQSLDPDALMRDWNDASADSHDREKSRAAGITLSLYETLDADGQAACRERGITPPPYDLVHITPWWFGMSFEGNEVDENGVQTGAAWWWRIVQVTFRLMQQRIAVRHSERAERPQRRQAKRLHFPERETLVVRLRRESGEVKPGSGEPARYSHRFIVHGFWRNQWYPSSQEHRQIWVSDYVKGDESLPLVIKPRRAFSLNR